MLKRIIEWSVREQAASCCCSRSRLPSAGSSRCGARRSRRCRTCRDVQVIVQADYNEQAPRIVEDQVTYPIAAEMLKVPGARTVRGLFVLRRLVRLRHLRGRHRSLLGALARAGVPERHQGQAAGDRDADPGPRRDGTGLGLPVRAGGHDRHARPRAAARRAGLVSPLRAHRGARRVGGRERRRVREAVSGGHRSGEAARVRHSGHARHDAPSRTRTTTSARW